MSFDANSCQFMSFVICHLTFPEIQKSEGLRERVKYFFLGLRQMLCCQAKGKNRVWTEFFSMLWKKRLLSVFLEGADRLKGGGRDAPDPPTTCLLRLLLLLGRRAHGAGLHGCDRCRRAAIGRGWHSATVCQFLAHNAWKTIECFLDRF
jgi:hypothetical protein